MSRSATQRNTKLPSLMTWKKCLQTGWQAERHHLAVAGMLCKQIACRLLVLRGNGYSRGLLEVLEKVLSDNLDVAADSREINKHGSLVSRDECVQDSHFSNVRSVSQSIDRKTVNDFNLLLRLTFFLIYKISKKQQQ